MEMDLKIFKILDFYLLSSKYYVNLKFVKVKDEKVFEMKIFISRKFKYIKYGIVFFFIDGIVLKLNVYQDIEFLKFDEYKDYLFLLFLDKICGKESYIGGRYIDLKILKGNMILIDFNKVYNLYCVYNYKYLCLIVFLENDLNVEIKVGVKIFY